MSISAIPEYRLPSKPWEYDNFLLAIQWANGNLEDNLRQGAVDLVYMENLPKRVDDIVQRWRYGRQNEPQLDHKFVDFLAYLGLALTDPANQTKELQPIKDALDIHHKLFIKAIAD